NTSQVERPSRSTPVSSMVPSAKSSRATSGGPERNAQPPPGVPPVPSGSSTTPSSVTNWMTTTLPVPVPMSVSMVVPPVLAGGMPRHPYVPTTIGELIGRAEPLHHDHGGPAAPTSDPDLLDWPHAQGL